MNDLFAGLRAIDGFRYVCVGPLLREFAPILVSVLQVSCAVRSWYARPRRSSFENNRTSHIGWFCREIQIARKL